MSSAQKSSQLGKSFNHDQTIDRAKGRGNWILDHIVSWVRKDYVKYRIYLKYWWRPKEHIRVWWQTWRRRCPKCKSDNWSLSTKHLEKDRSGRANFTCLECDHKYLAPWK